VDVDAVADELYGLPLDEFTAARNAYVKQARQSGERDAAASIQALAKPSAAAGLANQLVRQHRAELAPLLELGASLRAATASLSGPELRTLGQQQHRLISALVAQARSTAAADGRTVNADQARGLEETLHAALADESAGDQLLTGRLTETLHRSGLSTSAEADGSSKSVPLKSVSLKAVPTGQSRREQAERAAQAKRDEATGRLEKARTALDRAETEAAEADQRWDRAKAEVDRLREQLDRAAAEQKETERVRHRLRAKTEQARRVERAAQHRLGAVE
jgi:chromosome segregation ATPase